MTSLQLGLQAHSCCQPKTGCHHVLRPCWARPRPWQICTPQVQRAVCDHYLLCAGVQEAVVTCLNKQTREIADETLCVSSRRPPQLLKTCGLDPCPPR